MSAINEGLKLCPWCQKTPITKVTHIGENSWSAFVGCFDGVCDVSQYRTGSTREEALKNAIEAWNNRPTENALRAELEQVKREREKFASMCNLIAKMTVEIIRENDCVFPRGWQYEKNIIEWAAQEAARLEKDNPQ